VNANDIIKAIAKAFPLHPVPIVSGLFQTQAGDELYMGKITVEEAAEAKERDRRRPWNEYSDKDLRRLDAAMAHQVPEGFVFFLPAYLCAVLRYLDNPAADEWDDFTCHVTFLVTSGSDYNLARLELLTSSQREAVAHFLEYIAKHGGEFNAEHAARALEIYWRKPNRS
jgi:hypothetical protein